MNAINPPWMKGSKDISGQKMIIVHMQPGEIEGLNNLQNGESIDPELGIPEFSKVGEIIEIPEVRQKFVEIANELDKYGKLTPATEKAYEIARSEFPTYEETPEEKNNPYLQEMEETGRGGDTKFALIPLNLAFFLIELNHVPVINPITKLLAFGFFKSLGKIVSAPFKMVRNVVSKPSTILPIAGTLIGAGLFGPLGAGAGNMLGRVATGSNFRDALRGGLTTGALAYGVQGLGQAYGLSGNTPYTSNFFGGGPNMLATGLGKLGVGTLAAGAAGANIGNAPQLAIGNTAANVGKAAAVPQGGFMSMFGKIAPFAPLVAAGLSYVGSQQKYKKDKQNYAQQRADIERRRNELGFNDDWAPVKPRNRIPNPNFYTATPLEREYGIINERPFIDEEVARYAKGGLVKEFKEGSLIKGPGKGQDDKIKVTVPNDAYIYDAATVSMLGDGSTEAGNKILKTFADQILKKFKTKNIKKKNTKIPVRLSNGERAESPIVVSMLGNGSNAKGAEILDAMRMKLRLHKNSNGSGLPPKAKKPMEYIQNI